MRTDDSIKVRCDDCLKRNSDTKPTTKIKLIRVGNKEKLVCLDHLWYYNKQKVQRPESV